MRTAVFFKQIFFKSQKEDEKSQQLYLQHEAFLAGSTIIVVGKGIVDSKSNPRQGSFRSTFKNA